MLKIKNLLTEVEYEAMQYEEYNREQVNKCKSFITEKLDLYVRVIMPNLHVCNLKQHGQDSIIKPTDYIIRRVSDRRMLNVISEEIFKSNFEILCKVG